MATICKANQFASLRSSPSIVLILLSARQLRWSRGSVRQFSRWLSVGVVIHRVKHYTGTAVLDKQFADTVGVFHQGLKLLLRQEQFSAIRMEEAGACLVWLVATNVDQRTTAQEANARKHMTKLSNLYRVRNFINLHGVRPGLAGATRARIHRFGIACRALRTAANALLPTSEEFLLRHFK